MVSAFCISTYLIYCLVIANAQINVKIPFGSRMCTELCSQIESCLIPGYDEHSLTCCMSAGKEMNVSGEYDRCKTTMGCNHTQMKFGRYITTHTGNKVTVFYERDSVQEAKDREVCNQLQGKYNRTADRKFGVLVPARVLQQNCMLSSMASSLRHADMLYLLLNCWNIDRCFIRLHCVDLKTNTFIPGKAKFCEPRSVQRQILTGPCITNTSDQCVFSIILYKRQLKFESANEPERRRLNAFWFATTHQGSSYKSKAVCTVYKPREFLCLMNGGSFCLHHLYPNKFVSEQQTPPNWDISSFPDLMDFKIDGVINGEIATGSAVIVYNHSVSVFSLNFINEIIIRKSSISIEAEAATFTKGVIILHGKNLQEPFFIFKAEELSEM